MQDFVAQRIAALRGATPDDPKWLEIYEEVAPDVIRHLGADNALDLFLLAALDEHDLDELLNRAWYATVHQQAEDYFYRYSEDDSYDDYGHPADYDFAAPADVWEEADRLERKLKTSRG